MWLTFAQAILLGVGTLLALWTTLTTQRERREEVRDAWTRDYAQALGRVADAVVELADAGEQARLRELLKNPNPLFAGSVHPSEIRPSSTPLARMKLRAALASLPAPFGFPKCQHLLDLDPLMVEGIPANEALDEVNRAMHVLAVQRAKTRARRGSSPVRRVRIWLAWRTRNIKRKRP